MIKRKKPFSKKQSLRANELLHQAHALHQTGQLQQAESMYISIISKYPACVDAIHLLGVIAHQVGRQDIAISRFQQTLQIKPDFAEAHYNLGVAFQLTGQFDESTSHYKQALANKPNYAEAHNNLGNNLKMQGKDKEAREHYESALSIKPDYVDSHNNLGVMLQKQGHHKEAINHFNQVIAINPNLSEAYLNIANSFQKQDKVDDAILNYEKALALKPDHAECNYNLGVLFQELGKKEKAFEHYEQAVAIKPDYAEAYYSLALLKPDMKYVAVIEKFLSNPNIQEKPAKYYYFALGNIYNHDKDYIKAFDYFIKANALKRKTISFDSNTHSELVSRLIRCYSAEYFQEKQLLGSDSELPVFILGMPRSGTTLVEQIISSHPQIYGAGELDCFHDMVKAITQQYESTNTYPECMDLFNKSDINKYANEYLNTIKSYSKNLRHVTDKMPANCFKLGLIKTLFPKARIIHCKRNALDTCVSIFVNNFRSGNEYSFDLTEIGNYYLQYERLMNHWHDLFPDEIFDVQYEELVVNQEKISRQLISYIGLDWDDACLDFHRNKRAVKTASNLQVRQPMNNMSVERWKRYGDKLKPLIDVFQNASTNSTAKKIPNE